MHRALDAVKAATAYDLGRMSSIEQKFAKLGTDHAPGQEVRQVDDGADASLRGDPLPGVPVDFSHGDVNETAFGPTPGALEEFVEGVHRGGPQAYTEYRGGAELRERLAEKLATFTGRPVSSQRELIITPGTQGALFLAIGATVAAGDRVAIVRPDYFANRKLVEFLGAEIAPVRLDYLDHTDRAGLDLTQLEDVFKSGVRTFLFSNPNNPVGVVYSPAEIAAIARLAAKYGVTVIVDELYSRLLYAGQTYTHLRATAAETYPSVCVIEPVTPCGHPGAPFAVRGIRTSGRGYPRATRACCAHSRPARNCHCRLGTAPTRSGGNSTASMPGTPARAAMPSEQIVNWRTPVSGSTPVVVADERQELSMITLPMAGKWPSCG